MSVVLGVNAVFHDPAAALVIDGEIVAAAEEERFSRRKHGKPAVPFATWEVPIEAITWCLTHAGLRPDDVDRVGYSYDPAVAHPAAAEPALGDRGFDRVEDLMADEWEGLRTLYTLRAPRFLRSAVPGLDPDRVEFVPHHVAHAASTGLAAPYDDPAVLVLDGRGERHSHLAGRVQGNSFEVLAAQSLPHSLGLMYEELTEHVGFHRSSDEYKVMALASYAEPEFLDAFRDLVRVTEDGGFTVDTIDWARFAPPLERGAEPTDRHAALAASVQCRLEEVILDLARWLHRRTAATSIALAGGVALNCVANGRLVAEGPFEHVWVQPAAGDAGTALGAALHLAARSGDPISPMTTVALGRGFDDEQLERVLVDADVRFERPVDIASATADVLSRRGVVGWFEGRSEFGPRALGHRSLLADPRDPDMVHRLNDVKGREQFRPVAPMVSLERAAEIFDGQLPSPYMLFVHRVHDDWRERIPAVVHVDGTARVQTVDRSDEPLLGRLLDEFDHRTGVPVLVNTSFNTAGRPMVDHPREALECFGAAPIDALVLGPFLVRRPR
jgi:carbamoyltransferase